MPGTRRISAGVSGSPGRVPALRQIWRDDARRPLWDTLDATFGGLPERLA